MEIIITLVIVALAIFIIYKNLKRSSKGECNCNSCNSHCSKYKDKKDKSQL
ncbi:FeoB-associated Cys-rich membrane protein [Clostridium fallax]|uniref:Virus attachment protein p12 family protein n=1 Tax=Clostridium fallax TaxID=1533 RepID=A0A1M4ZNB1_9CLOT|nr:FeoB-associated Cys-rich membrane protein [Clostridium fallax]SHF19282.1 Virus attachment protein p12 family protein [Clostridium fallax]SQB07392.1 Virus attachment protein p12 family [Clostridium fallax]